MANIQQLIRFIVWYATDHETRLTTTRLVKFLYLADLHHARAFKGETYTRFPWAFIHYGPYCQEAQAAIDEAVVNDLISRKPFTGVHASGAVFLCTDWGAELSEEQLPIQLVSPLKKDILRFGDETPILLDYVYFESEVLEGVRKGERIDFSKAKPIPKPPTITFKKIPEDHLKSCRENIANLTKKQMSSLKRKQEEPFTPEELKDDVYEQAMEYLDGDDARWDFQGEAKILR